MLLDAFSCSSALADIYLQSPHVLKPRFSLLFHFADLQNWGPSGDLTLTANFTNPLLLRGHAVEASL